MSSDDDSELSTSSREYLESPLKARREALKQKLRKEGFHTAAQSGERKNLQLSVLKAEVTKDRKAQVSKSLQNDRPSSFGTKTREQELKSQAMGADFQPTADQMMQQGNAHQKADDLLKKDEAQSEDA